MKDILPIGGSMSRKKIGKFVKAFFYWNDGKQSLTKSFFTISAGNFMAICWIGALLKLPNQVYISLGTFVAVCLTNYIAAKALKNGKSKGNS
jgi:hypothetical protein